MALLINRTFAPNSLFKRVLVKLRIILNKVFIHNGQNGVVN